MTLRIRQDAWARLAAAAGYNARGTHNDRVQAEHHLGMFLGIVSRGGDAPLVTMEEAKEMMLEVFGVAYGQESLPQPDTKLIQEPRRCSARVVGRHGVIERCQNAAINGESMCRRCSKINPSV